MNNPMIVKEQKLLQFNRGNPNSPAPERSGEDDLKQDQHKISDKEIKEAPLADEEKQEDAQKEENRKEEKIRF